MSIFFNLVLLFYSYNYIFIIHFFYKLKTCELPEVLDNNGTSCVNTFDQVGWIDRTSDNCNGVRPTSVNPNVLILRSVTAYRLNTPPIPEGYRWLTGSEYTILTEGGNTHNYYNKCGINGYSNSVNENTAQYEISFSDTTTTNCRTHSGTIEGRTDCGGGWDRPNNWLGIAVIRNDL